MSVPVQSPSVLHRRSLVTQVQSGTPSRAVVAFQPKSKLRLLAQRASSQSALFPSTTRVMSLLLRARAMDRPHRFVILWYASWMSFGTQLVAAAFNRRPTKLRLLAQKVRSKFALFPTTKRVMSPLLRASVSHCQSRSVIRCSAKPTSFGILHFANANLYRLILVAII